ncbi:beta-1,4 N-acetylgalactosaminyltransferase 1 isoform X1 [Entelurus aequoreus]|uniref:beta-1,4 N-acetylgalactosaminyltransferase 1 isoform X1 n=2 Tax=Entelurus aequoreus TaxID=161455 RepID=UPI002B1D02FA|nr:beta-1,4 N-acetylgalactosaminyltransferase 1 isoform X1 [Entelurus aequoreus]XP_061894008.1 beta-1,4 N-acetylgalactosaminyltransferase 1 isoform X1 [Entelurus aequoreus]XP_061894009.1 beta-1,4 N-acetylgalactosaminyltransferase 1 isoform X1 [Entelurus aequoreus]XP_061894010.1 beta-1,4 N-acetylgalactosaminyltransferase 1 isoform X1 [Entelurus aequoreus]XP_061894011.1 beta-1,4 N-acetylgalactosaminyltransferase 1 isoform X1 [Entelurus aequoreus]XP_061894012.1 beta-1,4 N-acetylgalactosaminyltran
MRYRKTVFLAVLVSVLLVLTLIHTWTSSHAYTSVEVWQRPELLERHDDRVPDPDPVLRTIPFHVRDSVASLLARNGCVCESEGINLPFLQMLTTRVAARPLHTAFQPSELEEVKRRREKEFRSLQNRLHTPADSLIIAQANNPWQYPTQGLEVRPLKTIIIPGLALHRLLPSQLYSVNLSASLGTLNVAAEVDGVEIRGDGETRMSLSSGLLSKLNRQLQFVTYTNTLFHPDTADTVHLETAHHGAKFTIKVRHGVTSKLYNTGPDEGPQGEYNISTLVTIATKTLLRYDKLQALIDSVREYYPSVTIVIADDSEDPQPVRGPNIEHYIMPSGKGWFAGRNLAVSQVTSKYVLWVDDDFIFTSKTKVEKLVDVLEKTTLDLVGGAVREVTGYSSTYRHTISVEGGKEEGDCLHLRRGFHHVIQGFPNCVVTDGVINFFLARTDKVRQVGFDPRLSRVAHLEFFIDGLGSLHVGSCDDVVVDHASKIKLPWVSPSQSDKAYAKFRYASASPNKFGTPYFRNRFQCLTKS